MPDNRNHNPINHENQTQAAEEDVVQQAMPEQTRPNIGQLHLPTSRTQRRLLREATLIALEAEVILGNDFILVTYMPPSVSSDADFSVAVHAFYHLAYMIHREDALVLSDRLGGIIMMCMYRPPARPQLTISNTSEIMPRALFVQVNSDELSGQGLQEQAHAEDSIISESQLEKYIQQRLEDSNGTISIQGSGDRDCQLSSIHDCLCPITQSVFQQPVRASDGHCYEYQALMVHSQQNAIFDLETEQWRVKSPMTREFLQWQVVFDSPMMQFINQMIDEVNQRIRKQQQEQATALGGQHLFAAKKRSANDDHIECDEASLPKRQKVHQ